MNVLCFGQELVEEDELAKKILPELREKNPEVNFIPCPDPLEILSHQEKEEDFLILDVANVPKVTLIDDVNKIKEKKLSTAHDFDLGFFLKLMENFSKNLKIRIICLPQKGNKKEIVREVKKILDNLNS